MCARLCVLALAPLALFAQRPCDNTPAYTPCEIAFELPAQTANPYATAELKIEFRSPRFRTLAIPGFWDGGKRMIVRFSPTEGGDWQYHVTSNIPDWNDKEGAFTAAASDAPGFIRTAEVHHWAYTERNLPHLWMGANEPRLASLDDAAFHAMADARAAQKFNHVRTVIMGEGAYSSADAPNAAWFNRLDERIRYLNEKGIVADLVLAPRPSFLTGLFPTWEQRRRFVRYLAARYAPMNVTWQGVQEFESDRDSRALLKEIGGVLKEADPYEHPRTSGARVTSAPLLDDGWMNFVAYGPGAGDSVGAVEHQLYPVPFINADMGRDDDPAAFRRRLWNATMDGQYPTYSGGAQDPNSPGAKAMTAWFDFFSGTRHWEMEPYFDVDGARALALEDTDYVAYVEKPGPVELIVEKHAYEVLWMNPADGETTKQKKNFNGDHFTGEPPDKSHDWVLRLVRPGRIESMARSYKFESRDSEEGSRALPITIQEIETNPDKVPFQVEQPAGDLSISKPTPYSAKISRQTRATASMTWLWTGEVTSDQQGYRVLGTGDKGTMQPSESMAKALPATLLVRLYGMNARGKVYELNKVCQLTP